MEKASSGAQARPREGDPGRRPRPDPRHPERPRARAGEPRGERNGDARRDVAGRREDRDRHRDRGRDARPDRAQAAGRRAGEQGVPAKSRQSRRPEQPRGPGWDAAPPPWPAPWETPEPPAPRKEGFAHRGPESYGEPPSGRYVPAHPRSGQEEVEYYQSEAEGLLECHKCRFLCTGRACCQMLEVLLNLLILACNSVSYTSTGGYTGITSLGGIYYYQYGGAYSGFDGADGEKAKQLDVQFYQLKLPMVTAAMAYSGALMAFSCLLIVMGVLRVPWHCPLWLLIEGFLDMVIAGAYIPAMYFFFHHLSAAYASPVCQERQALYQSKGYQGFSCGFHGGDIAAGIFASLAIGVFALGAVLAIRAYRKVQKLKEKPAEMLEF
ncbi:MARVEL domain-containing protein 3 isoform X2 [Octodon degus]|uniref:MARVEL domain-containing protein 3 isoform X2 n=1 Tax=Octodon degus TaxID=10160 RepID=A0A6P3V9V9_OCTDE|nr:MARVEL domain-containing protein 3 isoform X2 [Octodon degus]